LIDLHPVTRLDVKYRFRIQFGLSGSISPWIPSHSMQNREIKSSSTSNVLMQYSIMDVMHPRIIGSSSARGIQTLQCPNLICRHAKLLPALQRRDKLKVQNIGSWKWVNEHRLGCNRKGGQQKAVAQLLKRRIDIQQSLRSSGQVEPSRRELILFPTEM
jgi:hypothetical protein